MVRYHHFTSAAILSTIFLLTACDCEDPGPLQEVRKDFVITDFDRLEIGDGFRIQVEQANAFSVNIRGDRRNVDDLDVYTRGATLVIEFDDHRERRHDTYIEITMPTLDGVNFSGGSESRISGFNSADEVDLYLSGGSVSQVESEFNRIKCVVSGGSNLLLFGSGQELTGEISGASSLKAFDYPVREAIIEVSGASVGRLTVTDQLTVTAAGASSVLYRGDPTVSANTSGAASVKKD